MKRIVLTVITGPEMGRRLEVAPEGATLGRSSRMADLKLSDGMLSRLHCRFFLEDDRAMVQDLGSSNGTSLNGTPLGAEPTAMAPGDVVTVGETGLRVTLEDAAPGAPTAPTPPPAPETPPAPSPVSPLPPEPKAEATPKEAAPEGPIDLGLSDEKPAANGPRKGLLAGLAVGVAALVCLAVGVRLFMATDAPTEEQMRTLQTPAEQPFEFRYERLKINDTSLYRYILTYDNTGTLALDIVDLGMDDRSYAKQKKLDADAQAALRRTVLGSGYAGIPALTPQQSTDGTLNRSTLTLAVGTEVWTRTAENTSNRAFDTYCAQLEEFARTALGAIATQYSVEELRVLAQEQLALARRHWEQRDGAENELFQSVQAYRQGLSYLETLNPKPDFAADLTRGLDEAEALLDQRYNDLRFQVEQAENTGRLDDAARLLQRVLRLIPDREDARHEAAQIRLLTLENLKKGGR